MLFDSKCFEISFTIFQGIYDSTFFITTVPAKLQTYFINCDGHAYYTQEGEQTFSPRNKQMCFIRGSPLRDIISLNRRDPGWAFLEDGNATPTLQRKKRQPVPQRVEGPISNMVPC